MLEPELGQEHRLVLEQGQGQGLEHKLVLVLVLVLEHKLVPGQVPGLEHMLLLEQEQVCSWSFVAWQGQLQQWQRRQGSKGHLRVGLRLSYAGYFNYFDKKVESLFSFIISFVGSFSSLFVHLFAFVSHSFRIFDLHRPLFLRRP